MSRATLAIVLARIGDVVERAILRRRSALPNGVAALIERRVVLARAAQAWAAVIAVIAALTFHLVNTDARWIVGFLTAFGIVAAVAASVELRRGSDRLAGALLVASIVAPTYMAYPLAIPALVLGLALLVAPGAILAPAPRTVDTAGAAEPR